MWVFSSKRADYVIELKSLATFNSVFIRQVDGLNSLHSVKASPNRFTKTSQGRSWNTGNGSPDAICLTVDKPGVVLVGVCVYGGGGIHEYELEVLADDVSVYGDTFQLSLCASWWLIHSSSSLLQAQTEHPGDSAHSHRWTSLELVKGTYSTDDSASDIAEIRLDKAVPLKVQKLSEENGALIFCKNTKPNKHRRFCVAGRCEVCSATPKLRQPDSEWRRRYDHSAVL